MVQTIQQLLDVIEQQLDAQLNIADLAKESGYSLFRFYRIFQQEVGLSPMHYIIRRKLLAALVDIDQGMSITETALKYGFATHSGFYRSFVKEYGMSPSNYLAIHPCPVQYRVQLEKERYKFMHITQVRKLLSEWRIDEQTKIIPVYQVNNGHLSEHVWRIGEDYYLKLFDTLESLQKELTVITQAGNTQKIFPSISNEPYIQYKNNYFVLFHKITGTPILSADILKQPKNGYFVGEIIGQITLSLSKVTGVFPDSNLLRSVTHWALPQATQLLNLSSEWRDDFQKQLALFAPNLPRQLIHRDLNGGNILIEKETFTPIDFDLVEINYRIYDPCYFLTSVLSEQFTKESFTYSNWLKLAKEVFTGYDQVVSLTQQEKLALPYIILANQMVCVAYFNDYDKYSHFLQINMQITQFLIDEFEGLQSVSYTL